MTRFHNGARVSTRTERLCEQIERTFAPPQQHRPDRIVQLAGEMARNNKHKSWARRWLRSEGMG